MRTFGEAALKRRRWALPVPGSTEIRQYDKRTPLELEQQPRAVRCPPGVPSTRCAQVCPAPGVPNAATKLRCWGLCSPPSPSALPLGHAPPHLALRRFAGLGLVRLKRGQAALHLSVLGLCSADTAGECVRRGLKREAPCMATPLGAPDKLRRRGLHEERRAKLVMHWDEVQAAGASVGWGVGCACGVVLVAGGSWRLARGLRAGPPAPSACICSERHAPCARPPSGPEPAFN